MPNKISMIQTAKQDALTFESWISRDDEKRKQTLIIPLKLSILLGLCYLA